jgi:arylsulfatase A-like enzyme
MRLLLALLLACSTPEASPTPATPARRAGVGQVQPGEDPGLIVMVVLDAVRADHTSLCGYDRPTTPFLQSLEARRGASHTCGAHASASWTLPSHAGLFTGTSLLEHHYDSAVEPDWSELPTLAERLQTRGYRTVMVTANPVVANARLLTRGFELVRSAERLSDWRGPALAEQVAAALDEVGQAEKLFLFVNIMDAHDPYPAVPEGLDWIPAREALDLRVADPEHDQPYHRFVDGRMPVENRVKFLRTLRDVYDYGVLEADRSLRRVVDLLQDRKLANRGLRMVVTADHGEFLGEHDRLRHGGAVWEPVTHVPFLYLASTESPMPELRESAFSHLNAFDLLLTGALPERLHPSVAFSSASGRNYLPGANMVAVWAADNHKLVWDRGIQGRFDLTTDPDELHGKAPWKHPRMSDLNEVVERYLAHLEWRWSEKANAETRSALDALGYLSEDP